MATPTSVHDQAVSGAIQEARARAAAPQLPTGRRPYPSPEDWRDVCIYFLILDRFASASSPPAHAWNQSWGGRQGGTFEGVRQQLPYLRSLGVNALWITSVVRNCAGSRLMTYHGYAAQDLLAVDERWASDGTRATAEAELQGLVGAAHDLGMWIILDVVLNHTGEVFWYDRGGIRESFQDAALLHQSRDGGALPGVVWSNGYGNPEPAWRDELQPGQAAGPDDAVYPIQLRDSRAFRRRGDKVSDRLADFPELGFIPGDFGNMRQLAFEYEALAGDPLRAEGRFPVLSVLLRAYQYLVARFDLDGLRIDTAKYVDPKFLQRFGTAMNEFAYTIGKKNFFQFGEVWDDAYNIARFVGRNGGSEPQGGFGIDAGLDFPVAQTIRSVCTGLFDQRQTVSALRDVYDVRRNYQDELICSHGDASSYFVLFLDNHDEHARIRHPRSPDAEVRLCLGLLFTLPGIPCLYYGTEQDLHGTADPQGNPTLDSYESVREALWGKFLPAAPSAAQLAAPWPQGGTFQMIEALIDVRRQSPALRYGRYYFRQVSGDGDHFGWPMDKGGVFAFSRVQADEEVLVVAYPNPFQSWTGWVEVDGDLNPDGSRWQVVFSTLGNGGTFTTRGYGPPPTRCAIQVTLASNELLVIARR
jgi:glycosidase